jgi:large subunit ribosomal protein L16
MSWKKTYKFSLLKCSYYLNKRYKIIFGNFGLKSLNSGLVSQRHLENVRRKLSKQFKRLNSISKIKIYIRLYIWKAYTKKPMLSRMGKGAGVISYWKSFVKPGFIIFEILSYESFLIISNIVKRSLFNFPLKLILIKKEF